MLIGYNRKLTTLSKTSVAKCHCKNKLQAADSERLASHDGVTQTYIAIMSPWRHTRIHVTLAFAMNTFS